MEPLQLRVRYRVGDLLGRTTRPPGAPERVPVQGLWGHGRWITRPGTVSWEEHELAWLAHRARWGSLGPGDSARAWADRGGFTLHELEELLGHRPRSFQELDHQGPPTP